MPLDSTFSLQGLGEEGLAIGGPDYTHQLANMAASQKSLAEIQLNADQAKQMEVLHAHQDADLAAAKAQKAQMDAHSAELEYLNSPEGQKAISQKNYEEAQAAIYTAKLKKDPVFAATESAKTAATTAGLDVTQYQLQNGSYDLKSMLEDTTRMNARRALTPFGTSEQAMADTGGQTNAEKWNTPATDAGPDGGSLAGSPDPTAPAQDPTAAAPDGGSLAGSPDPTAPAQDPTAATPAPASKGSLAPAPASKGSLAAAPVPGSPPAGPMMVPSDEGHQVELPSSMVPRGPARKARMLANARMAIYMRDHIPPRLVGDGAAYKEAGITTAKEPFLDPSTGKTYEAVVARDAGGDVVEPPKGVTLKERSEVQREIDKKAGEAYVVWQTTGEKTRGTNDLNRLDGVIDVLLDPKTKLASGALVQMLPKGLRYWTTPENALNAPQQVKIVALNHLKELFGGRITNQELDTTMNLLFDPGLDEKTNAAKISQMRKDLSDALIDKRAEMAYFRDHKGTLEGYVAPSERDDGPKSAAEVAPAAVAAPASPDEIRYAPVPRGSPPGTKGIPYKYWKDEQTGKYNWVRL